MGAFDDIPIDQTTSNADQKQIVNNSLSRKQANQQETFQTDPNQPDLSKRLIDVAKTGNLSSLFPEIQFGIENAPIVQNLTKAGQSSEAFRATGLRQLLRGLPAISAGENPKQTIKDVFGDIPLQIGDVLREKGISESLSTIGGLVGEILTEPSGLATASEAQLGKLSKPGISASVAKKSAEVQAILDPSLSKKISSNFLSNTEQSLLKYDDEINTIQNKLLTLEEQRRLAPSVNIKKALDEDAKLLGNEISKLNKDKIMLEGSFDFAKQRFKPVFSGTASFKRFVQGFGPEGETLARQFDRQDLQRLKLRSKWFQEFDPQGQFIKAFDGLSDDQADELMAALDKGSPTQDPIILDLIRKHDKNWFEIGTSAIRNGIETEGVPFQRLDSTKKLPHFTLTNDQVLKNPDKLTKAIKYQVKQGVFKSEKEGNELWDSFQSIIRGHVDDDLPMPKNKKTEKFYDYLIKKKQATNIEDAELKLRKYLTRAKSPRFGSLEHSRSLDIPFYDTEPHSVLARYYSGAAKRLSEVENFGRNDEIVNSLFSKISEKATKEDLEYIQKGFRYMTGAENPESNKFLSDAGRFVRNINAAAKLGKFVLTNIAQPFVTTAPVVGVRRTVGSMVNAIKNSDPSFLNKFQSILQDSSKIMYGVSDNTIDAKLAETVLKVQGGNASENFNRLVTAVASKDYAKELGIKLVNAPSGSKLDKQIRRALIKMDLRPEKIIKNKGIIDEEDLVRAGQNLIRDTQFMNRVLDTPLWAQTSVGRVVNQFHIFSERMWAFMRDEILSEVKEGNYAPLVRFATLAPPITMGLRSVKENVSNTISKLIGGNEKPTSAETKTILERYIDAAAMSGSLSILYDMWQNVKFDKDSGLYDFIASGGTIHDLIGGGQTAIETVLDDNTAQLVNLRPLTRTAVSLTPFIGPELKRNLEPGSTTLRRFTNAVKDAEKRGLSTSSILEKASQAGIDPNKVLKNVRSSTKRKTSKETRLREAGLLSRLGFEE